MSWTPPTPRGDLLWAAVDLDGTLARSEWTPENPNAQIGEPIWRNTNKLFGLIEDGFKIIIHTSRPWADYEAIESWCTYYNIPFSRIVCGKLLAAVYIDDRNISVDAEDWNGS